MKNTYRTTEPRRSSFVNDGLFLLILFVMLTMLGLSYLTMKRVRASETRIQAIEHRIR